MRPLESYNFWFFYLKNGNNTPNKVVGWTEIAHTKTLIEHTAELDNVIVVFHYLVSPMVTGSKLTEHGQND